MEGWKLSFKLHDAQRQNIWRNLFFPKDIYLGVYKSTVYLGRWVGVGACGVGGETQPDLAEAGSIVFILVS